MYAYYRQAKAGPIKTLRCHRKLGGCGRLARGAEPIETFLEAAVFEIVRHPAFAQFLDRRSTAPLERERLLEQLRAIEALQQENLVAYAAPEPGARRRSKAEYELIAARLDRQHDLRKRQPAETPAKNVRARQHRDCEDNAEQNEFPLHSPNESPAQEN